MKKIIRYKCGFSKCKKVYECEEGYFARVDCKHKIANGKEVEWYPVIILSVIERKS